jgi:predicted nuclease of restriction endonuclease-like (RecB) superfamily
VELLKLDNPIKREFYTSMCADGRWSVRTLRERMDSMLFERTAIAKQPDEIVQNGKEIWK